MKRRCVVALAVTLSSACSKTVPLATPAPPQTSHTSPAPAILTAPAAAPAPAPAATAAPAPASVNALDSLQRDLRAATQAAGVARGAWGIVVHSLDRDERLFELNPRTLLVPASAAKIVSIATAVDAVGWDFRWQTTLRATGPIAGGVLRGDLLISGTGDPSIGGRAGDDLSAWIRALRAAGITRIAGRVIGDDDGIEEPRPQLAWAWDDLGYTTGAIFGALNFAENRTTIGIAPGTAGGPATLALAPAFAYRQVSNRTVTGPAGSAQLLWAEQRPGETALTIAGTIAAGASPVVLGVAVGNPTLHAAQAIRSRIVDAGIEVSGDAYDIDDASPAPDRSAGTVLHVHRSRPLADIVQPMLKESINLYAEAALRLNAAPGAFPTNDAALAGMARHLDAWGIVAQDQQIIDGSGLSRRDVITPEALLVILRRMHTAGAAAAPFMTALPVAGVDGSLASRMRGTPAERNVRGKTGTMSNIRSLVGYVTTADGERLAFVVMVNNFEGPGAAAAQAIDAIAVRLASFRR
jgi:D-alanyl-D-alanine carboxypeptidase/D-alanyl-D-alanine-endopeptidase (penicillin-binding protein 4)